MDQQQKLSSTEITQLLKQQKNWYHQIEVAPGILTPGSHSSKIQLDYMDSQIGFPKNCSNLRVLDLGVRDGFFSFEAEKRGAAEVIGIDYVAPEKTGFNIASTLLNSKVKYYNDNVYNINPGDYGTFDIVLFLGLLYHLRNPMLVLDRIRDVTNPGGWLFIETQLSTDENINKLTVPAWQYLSGDSFNKDGSNKWAPNLIGLKSMVEDCVFNVSIAANWGTRGYIKAQAVDNKKAEIFKKADSSIGMWG